MTKEIMFTKGWFRASQGIALDPRHYEAIKQLKDICRKDSRLKPFKLSEELRPIIATLIEKKCQEIEEITGFNPLNNQSLPFSGQIELIEA